MKALRDLTKEAIDAQFLNIDVDSSTIVDLSRPNVKEQQRPNFEVAAEMIRFIRGIQPAGVDVSVGVEIGEVGKKNSTPEELRAFMDGLHETLAGKLQGPEQDKRSDRQQPRRRRPAGRHNREGRHRLRDAGGDVTRGPRGVRYGRRGAARRLDAARRAVPPLRRSRDGGDPPGDELPEHDLRQPALPGVAATGGLRLSQGEARRRVEGRVRRRRSSSTARARGAPGPSSVRCGTCRRRSAARCGNSSRTASRSCSSSCACPAQETFSPATSPAISTPPRYGTDGASAPPVIDIPTGRCR